MKKRIKIWFHSEGRPDIKEFSLGNAFVIAMVCLVIGGSTGLFYLGLDYYQLKQHAFDNKGLKETLALRNEELKLQRAQLHALAQDIEALKTQVRSIERLEEQVRIIADLGETQGASGLVGIGGVPDTPLLQHEMSIETRHTTLIREMHQQVKQVHGTAGKKELDLNDLINKLEKKKNILAATPSIRPVSGVITSPFGHRKSPFTGERGFHSGLDISNRKGTEIVATADGKISFAGKKRHYGNIVIIDHGFGKSTRYAHLNKIRVKRGQKVKRGDVIATLGNTGKSTGPHLHYEVRLNGTPVNPMNYILN